MIAFILLHWRACAALAITIVLAGYIETLRLEVDVADNARDKAVNEKAAFVNQTRMLGEQAKLKAQAEDAQNKLDKEKADEENKVAHDRDAGVITRLRLDAAKRDSRGGSVSEAPGGSKCPEGQTCFDRAEYQRTMGIADTGARQLADEGTSVTTDLDTAKRWAQ